MLELCLETHTRLLGPVLKVWSFEEKLSYNKLLLKNYHVVCLFEYFDEFKSSCNTPEVGPCGHRAGQQSRVQSSGDFLAVASLQQIELPLRMSAL